MPALPSRSRRARRARSDTGAASPMSRSRGAARLARRFVAVTLPPAPRSISTRYPVTVADCGLRPPREVDGHRVRRVDPAAIHEHRRVGIRQMRSGVMMLHAWRALARSRRERELVREVVRAGRGRATIRAVAESRSDVAHVDRRSASSRADEHARCSARRSASRCSCQNPSRTQPAETTIAKMTNASARRLTYGQVRRAVRHAGKLSRAARTLPHSARTTNDLGQALPEVARQPPVR